MWVFSAVFPSHCLCSFHVPQELVDLPLPPPHAYTIERATAEAVGVELNRLQNIVITLDKVKHCLNAADQVGGSPGCALGQALCGAYVVLNLEWHEAFDAQIC